MNFEHRFILHSRACLVPAGSLSPVHRSRLLARSSDVVVGIVGARAGSLVLGSEVAELVERFRQPMSIVDAVLDHARWGRTTPEEVLEASGPPLRCLIERGLLVDVDVDGDVDGDGDGDGVPQTSAEAEGPLWCPGDRPVAGVELVRRVHRLAGGEVHLARLEDGRFAAFKIETRDAGVGSLEREAEALAYLARRQGESADEAPVPALLGHGELPLESGAVGHWLSCSWVEGVDALRAGAVLRGEDSADGRASARRLVSLCRRIARAYAAIHRRGVLHGDVHAGNVLVDRQGGVTLIDFALARGLSVPLGQAPAPRAGVPFALEPELARAVLDGKSPPEVTMAGEQFALGALLYEVVVGSPYMDFRLDRLGLLRQIADPAPRSFASRGVLPWPAMEQVLRRALASRPEDRFADVESLDAALDATLDAGALEDGPKRRSSRRPRASQLAAVAGRVRRDVMRLTEPRLTEPLEPAIFDGAAGVAYTLLRLSAARAEPVSLAAAERWWSMATEGEPSIAKQRRLGRDAPFHARPGVVAVGAVLGHALADGPRRDVAIDEFLTSPLADASRAVEDELLGGRAGFLLLASTMQSLDPGSEVAARLRLVGDRCAEVLAEVLAGRLSGRLSGQLSGQMAGPGLARVDGGALPLGGYLGMAHGVAGVLYALLKWSTVSGSALAEGVLERLDELARLAAPRGRGLAWPRRSRTLVAGWCHGSAGHVLLWGLASRCTALIVSGFEAERCLTLAERAAWDAFEGPRSDGTLCCGFAGRSWALLHQAALSGDAIWRSRAAALAERAARSGFPDAAVSLFKGELSLALLESELALDRPVGFPFFEQETLRAFGAQRIDQLC